MCLCTLYGRSEDSIFAIPKVCAHPVMIDVFAHTSVGADFSSALTLLDYHHVDMVPVVNPGIGLGLHGNPGWAVEGWVGYAYAPLRVGGWRPIQTHWISAGVDIRFFIFLLGYQSMVRMPMNQQRDIPSDYVGVSPECFNKATHRLHVGLTTGYIPHTQLRMEVLIGYQLTSILNDQVVKNQLMTDNSGINTSVELRVIYRLFTTGRRKYLD